MITETTTISRSVLAAVAFALLAGCADKSAVDNVDKRAVERWTYLSAHQAEKAYDYLTPGFRATQSREGYASTMNNRPVQWKGATFKRKECDGDRCTAYVDVTYGVKMPSIPGQSGLVESTNTQTETWIRVDGEWFFLPK